jgi:putative flippase GtrA
MSKLFPTPEPYMTMRTAVALCGAMLLVTLLAYGLDDRMLRGVNIWSKPVKFALSFGIHLATLLWLASLLTHKAQHYFSTRLALIAAGVASVIEVFYVALQSARGRASHFNFETPFDSFMYYAVMGGSALVIVMATFALGLSVLRNPKPALATGLRLGAGWGAIFGAVATLIVAGALASGRFSGAGPWIGSLRTDAGGLPIVGWSTSVGDLRVPHFFATHLIQVLPIVGWLADKMASKTRNSPNPRWVVIVVLMLSLLLVGGLFVQALRGQPFIGQ